MEGELEIASAVNQNVNENNCDNLNNSNMNNLLDLNITKENEQNQLYTDIIAKDNNNQKTNNNFNSKLLYLNNLQIQCNNNAITSDDDDDEEEEEANALKDLVRATENAPLIETRQQNRMRLAFGVLLRLVIPLANSVAKGLKGIRDVQILRPLRNLPTSRQSLINMLAYAANTISMSLSSVQVAHRIDPILKMIKLRKGGTCIESLPDTPSIPLTSIIREPQIDFFPNNDRCVLSNFETAESTVTLNVLAEPPSGMPIRADIILIHGLHGSLVNTWKQGLWSKTRAPVHFERPPKPPLRPPKRPRHSRSNVFVPPHTTKRKRFADREHFTMQHDSEIFARDYYDCDTDYSFPTFRLRNDENVPSSHNDSNSTSENSENDRTTKSDEYSKCWPGDWLPLDCPGVRVIAVNYTTDQYLWRPVWKKKEARTNLVQRAREMTKLLIEQRVGYGHPIIWVGHSKGGLFVKQIIVEAWESGHPAVAPFWRSARGVFFYSVPHRGSHLASINAPLMRRSIELIDIEKNSKYLLDLHRRFAGLYHMRHLKIEVFSFVETALTLMSILYLRIVGVDSADPGIGEVCGIHLDHREICKPRNRDCILYKELVKMIKKVC